MIVRLIPVVLLAACASLSRGTAAPPSSFVRTTQEAPATRIIDVRDGLTHAQAMRLLTDALALRYAVDVTDARAGFVMTAWQATLQRDGVPDLRYRTRVVARFLGDDWRRVQLRHEANWSRGEEWDIGYDVAQVDSVAADLKARLGRK